MTSRLTGLAAGAVAALALTVLAPAARAQVTPGGMPGGGAGSGSDEQKPEGVAEEAPKTPGLLPTTPTLPPPKGKRNKFQLLELDGYFRFRGDYFKNFNLGFTDDPTKGGATFPTPLGCHAATNGMPGATTDRPCSTSVKSGNIRLRLEPRINVTESTVVHTQIDVLDNQVLGATPTDGWNGTGNTGGVGFLGDGQIPPQSGFNWSSDSIRVKRAWADITTPLGIIKVGRQPSHWGMGIWQNAGGEDPIDGNYNYDGDYGDTVDRLMFSTLIPGTKLRGAIATDWASTGLTSATSGAHGGTTRLGQAWDLDDNDDVNQWVIVLSKMDAPQDFRDTVDRGELALNYGTYFTYRTQNWDYNQLFNDPTGSTTTFVPDKFVPRDAKAYIPDAWVKLAWKQFTVEAEAVGVVGHINRLTDLGIKGSVNLRQFGGVARASVRAMNDKLKFGVEVGAASGDQNDHTPQGSINVADENPMPTGRDNTISWFRFDPDYHVDLILFRELMGTVTNATYAKPYLSYDLTKSIQLKVANVTSFALKPVATPGNGTMYGTEFDTDIGYQSSTFDAGLSYGVLFPLGALNHPADPGGTNGPGFGYPVDNQGDATTAHTLQARMVVKF